jgi:kynureninase
MEPTLRLMPGAEGWQLSNPPILPMACMMASLELFNQAGMSALRQKSLSLHQCLREQTEAIGHPNLRLLTPASEEEHGCQLSIQLLDANRKVHQRLTENQIITDWREPDVIRVAPVPIYNTFEDVYLFSQKLKEALSEF